MYCTVAPMNAPTRKKIFFVITKASWGGAQHYVYDLITALSKTEFEASVVFGQPGLLALKLKEAGITIKPILSLERNVSFFTDIQSFFELFRLFWKERPDVVPLNTKKGGGVGPVGARLAGVPRIIFTAHGWPFWEQRNPIPRGIIYFLSWLTALLSHIIIVVSDYDLRAAQKMPLVAHKTTRIYNGIDLHFPLGSADVIRHSFPKGVGIVGTIGELTRNKNQISLIERAKNDPTMYVAIVGDGEDRRYLMQKIEEYGLTARVKLFGFMPADEVLRGFDTFALPSLKEGLPYVLLEAKAAGLPIVANRVGGVGEILDAQDMSEFSLDAMVQRTAALY